MDRNIDIARFPKLSDLINKIIERLNTDWSKIFDQANEEKNLNLKGVENVPGSHILSLLLNQSMVFIEMVMDIGEKRTGKFYLMFMYKDVIRISGVALKEDTKTIEQQLETVSVTDEYTRSFNNFSELTCSGFDNVFCYHIPEKTLTRFNKYFISSKDNDELKVIFSSSEGQMIFKANFQYFLPQFSAINFDILFPLELVEGFFGTTIHFSRDKCLGKILVIDDSKSDISIIRQGLRNSNFQIIEGVDEQSTLHKLFAERVDLILIDIYLESENGLSICRRIRRNMMYDNVPIIMYSWGATRGNIEKSLRAGAQDFLAKPFNKEILLRKIQKHMPNKEAVVLY